MPSDARPWSLTPEGLTLTVRLTPKGGGDSIDGIEQLARRSVLKARVRAAASEGEANDALGRLMSEALDVAPRNATLESGAGARIKRLAVAGHPAKLAAALERIA